MKDLVTEDRQELISVIIPIYNMETYLPRCLDSVLHNSYQNLEILCINDGSIDQSLSILKRYAEDDARIILIDQKNSGVSSARNRGLERARGRYIAFVDADDWLHENYFEYLYRAITQCEGDFALCNLIKSSDDTILNDEIPFCCGKISIGELYSHHDYKSYVTAKLFCADTLRNLAFDEESKVLEDTLFLLELISKNSNMVIAKVEAILYAYYNRPDSLVSKIGVQELLQFSHKSLIYCDTIENKSIKSWIAEEAIKKSLSARYLAKLMKNREAILDCNRIMKDALRYVKNYKMRYLLMYSCPSLYRACRIWSDRSLLTFEKQIRESQKGAK